MKQAVEDPSRRCQATSKRSGAQCARWAYPGATVCATHGGKAPAVRAAADRRVAAEQVQADASAVLAHYGVQPLDDPLSELGKLASETRAVVNAFSQRVNALSDVEMLDNKNAPHAMATVELWERAQDRLFRILDALVKHGYMERQVKIQEQEAMLVAGVIKRVVAGLGLTAEQQKDAQRLLAEEFRSIGGLL